MNRQQPSFPIPLCHTGLVEMRQRTEKRIIKLSLGKKEAVLSFAFFFPHNATLNFPPVKSGFPMKVIGKLFPCFYLDPQAFSSYFSPILLREGSVRAVGWAYGSQQSFNSSQGQIINFLMAITESNFESQSYDKKNCV